jgi:DNA-directed RNA polymerase subunit E'/Rpb7
MDKIGQIFEGVISGVTEWGIYVEILENKCEGMVRARDMKDDFYNFDADNYRYVGKRTGNTYCLGDKVLIEVKTADMIKKQLTFAFVETLEKNKSQALSEKHEGHKGKEGHHRGKKNKFTNKKTKRRR